MKRSQYLLAVLVLIIGLIAPFSVVLGEVIEPVWDFEDNDCSSLATWQNSSHTTGYIDRIGTEPYVEVAPAGQWRFYCPVGGNLEYAAINKSYGIYGQDFPEDFLTIETKVYVDNVGTIPDNDHFYFTIYKGDRVFQLKWSSAGFSTRDESGDILVCDNSVANVNGNAEWQTWRFVFNIADYKLDVYLKNENEDWQVIATDISSGWPFTYSDGTIYMTARSYTNAQTEVHVDHLKIASGAHAPGIVNNQPPVVDAGLNVNISSSDVPYTQVTGTATDPDGDVLTYKWVIEAENGTVENGNAPTDLANLLLVGSHTMTLEVSDGIHTVSDSMILTVDNSSPIAVIQVSGSFKFGEDIVLQGTVVDFDGDSINYMWYEDDKTQPFATGTVATYIGEESAELPIHTITDGLSLGEHQIVLEVTDEYGNIDTKITTIEVIDTEAPTLAPIADPAIIWPPNGELYPVTVTANVTDNSGSTLTLAVSIECNGAPIIDDLGNILANFTEPVIDQVNGIITTELRAAKNDDGTERVFTISITATDESGNSTEANVKVLCPASRGKKN
ncbi:MAG: hypothetical protein KAI43_10025 [Candidatus Aureabacteria bacterium]|nr:hypothetical protein [Candidatus Auribacterota bacterium]